DNISKLEETIIKIQESYNKIDSTSGKSIRETASEKRKHYYLDKHGVEYYFQTDEFKIKYREIMFRKYNVENVGKSKWFKNEMIKRGIFKDDNTIELFETYSRNIRNMTKITFNENYDFLCDAYLRGN